MKILVFARGVPNKYDPQEGCFELDQALALKKRGHEVIIMSIDARLRKHRHQWGITKGNIQGIETYKIYWGTITAVEHLVSFILANKIYRKLAISLFSRILKDHPDIDIIHAHFLYTLNWATAIGEKFNIPVVGTEHWSEMVKPTISRRITDLAQDTYSKLDTLISVSEFLREKIYERFGVDSIVCPNVLSEVFDESSVIRKSKSNNMFNFVCCGSLIHRKGYDLIINAASCLNIPRDQWHISIIGAGPLLQQLERQATESGLGDNISFTGKLQKNEIINIFGESDCFILASRSETFGVVIIEANSIGLPAIVTDCGGTKGIVDDDNGIMIPVDNTERLVQAMEYMFHNKTKYDPDKIRRTCLEKYSPDAVGEQLESIYAGTIKEYKR